MAVKLGIDTKEDPILRYQKKYSSIIEKSFETKAIS